MNEMVGFVEEAKVNANSKKAAKKFEDIQIAIKKINREHHVYSKSVEDIFALVEKRDMDRVHKLSYDLEELQDKIDKELEVALLDIEHFTEKSIKTAADHEIVALVSSVLGLIIPIVLSFFLHLTSLIASAVVLGGSSACIAMLKLSQYSVISSSVS